MVTFAATRGGYARHAQYALPVAVYPELTDDIAPAVDSTRPVFRISVPLVTPPAGLANPADFVGALAGVSASNSLRERADAIHKAGLGSVLTYADAKETPVKELTADAFWKALNEGGEWKGDVVARPPSPSRSAARPAEVAESASDLPLIAIHEAHNPALVSPLMTKLYQESNLRLAPNRVALHPDDARAANLTNGCARHPANAHRQMHGGGNRGCGRSAGRGAGGWIRWNSGRVRRRRARQGGVRMIAENRKTPAARYGMTIDVDRCNGCGSCMVACAVENNVPPAAAGATDRTGLTWIRVFKIDNGAEGADRRSAFVPVLCQHCGKDAPCVSVCPQQAVDVDPATGIVGQMPERCLGCRYCMAACPYHARYFNWWDPAWPAGMEKTLNPDVAPRMRGVVEKCNFCHGRWHAAKAKAVANGKAEIDPADYVPACVEACPSGRDPLRRPQRSVQRNRAGRSSAEQFPHAGIAGYRSEDPLPVEEGLGARNRRALPAPERRTLVVKDKEFITRGVRRCSTPRFVLWLTPWVALLLSAPTARVCAW